MIGLKKTWTWVLCLVWICFVLTCGARFDEIRKYLRNSNAKKKINNKTIIKLYLDE